MASPTQIPMSGLKSQVLVSDGTVGVPSISFSGDSNTGLYRPGADALGVVTGGVERMRVGSDGNVGIGTTVANEKLTVAGNIDAFGVSRLVTINLSAQSTSLFYPVLFNNSADYSADQQTGAFTHYVSIEMPSQGGGNPYNMHSLHGVIRGGGWSDQEPKYTLFHNFFQSSERSILGIYRGIQAFYGICVYLRGGMTYTILTNSRSVVAYTSAVNVGGLSGYPNSFSTFAIKNGTGADASGTSYNIGLIWSGLGDAGLYTSHGITADGPIKNTNPCFQAHRNNTTVPGDGTAIIFQQVLVNRGSCYNNTNGRFTASVAGMYRFHFHSMNHNNAGWSAVVIRKNGNHYVAGHGGGVAYGHIGLSCIIELAVNEYVDIINVNGYAPLHPDYWTCFSGELVG